MSADLAEAAEPSERLYASEEFLCPISKDVMEDPVVAADGITYERSTIEKWIRDKEGELCAARKDILNCDATAKDKLQRIIDTGVKSPTLGIPLLNLNLVPNDDLAHNIRSFRDRRREMGIDGSDSRSGADSKCRGEGDGCSGGIGSGGGGGGGGSGGGASSGGGCSKIELTGAVKDFISQERDLASLLIHNGFEDVAAVFLDEEFDVDTFSILTSADLIDMKDLPPSRYGALLEFARLLSRR